MKAVKSPSRPVAELMRVTGATRANVRTSMAFKECPLSTNALPIYRCVAGAAPRHPISLLGAPAGRPAESPITNPTHHY